MRPLSWLLLPLLFACKGAEPQKAGGQYDPTLVADEKAKLDADASRRDFSRVLIQIDQALDSYVRAISNAGIPRFDTEREQLERLLRQLVSGTPPGSNAERLVAMASDGSDPFYQGIALAALGFADRSDAMAVILQGAQLTDEDLVDRAVLGLAILGDPRTPPGVIARIVEDPNHNERGRIGAAWALVDLQPKCTQADKILPVWTRILGAGADQHPLLLANALRGLGLSRDAQYADLAAGFIRHPTPRVRMNAAIALGRMNAQTRYEDLLRLLGPTETVPNVRLAARKALQQLAGDIDRGYDVALWRREFERGS